VCSTFSTYSAITKSSPAGRIQVCLTARIKFTGVPAETAGEISFEEIHSTVKRGHLKGSRSPVRAICAVEQSIAYYYCQI